VDSVPAALKRSEVELTYLINRASTLPRHYTLHKFWADFAGEFQHFIAELEPYKHRPSFLVLEEAAQELDRVARQLSPELEDYRLSLCRAYDIPAAPVAGLGPVEDTGVPLTN